MAQPKRSQSAGDTTKIFRMPTADPTAPNIMSAKKRKNPTLAIVKGPQTGVVFDLGDSIVTLGRDPNNEVFLNDMTVSRNHARMDLSGVAETGVATIEDLGSLNGTWVDGAIVNSAELADGSTIQIGTFRMVFNTNADESDEDESSEA